MTLPLLPYPRTLTQAGGTLTVHTPEVESADPELDEAAGLLASALADTASDNDGTTAIRLELDAGLTAPESYSLRIDQRSVLIRAADCAGAFYGGQTLLQLWPAASAPSELPLLEISDRPEYAWRGMHLDCSRHFFTVDFIKRYIDLLAMHKMNRFHWHLCDDQGWRLESRRYPRLTEVGAWRERSVVGHTANRERCYEEQSYGGFYTRAQVQDVVRYAAQRQIEVLPEIDVPGHAAALLAAYPALSCDGADYRVEEHYGIFPDVLCPSEATFEFLEALFTEVAELFPFKYVHIGGDEVVKDHWRDCPRCQRLMQHQGMHSVDQLHGYFVTRVESILAGLGRRAIGWNEVMDGEVSTATTIMCWTGFDACRAALKAGHETIMTPVECTYFDFYQSTSLDEPQAIHGLATVKQVFDYEPLPTGVPEDARPRILGAQANVWTEYLRDAAAVEYACLPRMSALAEVVWTGPERDWNSFCQRLPDWAARLNAAGYRVADSIYKPRILATAADSGGLTVSMQCDMPNMSIHYTTDGSVPTPTSARYLEPLQVDSDCVLRCCAFESGVQRGYGDERLHLSVHRALHRLIYRFDDGELVPAPEWQRLTNGCLGDERIFHGFEWTAFPDQETDLVVDLGQEQAVEQVRLNFEAGAHRQLFLPAAVSLLLSTDARSWQPWAASASLGEGRVSLAGPAQNVRYIRLRITNSDLHYGPEQRRPITRPVYLDELIVV